MSVYYIGLSTSGHDPSFAIVNELGDVIFAEATERYLQDKRAWGCFPDHKGHIETVLQEILDKDTEAKFKLSTSWKSVKAELPVEVSDELIKKSTSEWIKTLQEIIQKNAGVNCKTLLDGKLIGEIEHFDHHLCHAVAAVYSSPFDDGICLVLDGEGEVGAASLFQLTNGFLKRKWRSWGPGSLGIFYATITELCGFSSIAGEEWKVMGLAAYGQSEKQLVELLEKLILIENGRPVLGEKQVLQKNIKTLQQYARKSYEPILNAANLAASAQFVYNKLVNQMIKELSEKHQNFILTGGCALNSSFNGTILSNHLFSSVHIPSAPADDGNSIGAALLSWQQDHKVQALPFNNSTPFLGSRINPKHLDNLLKYSNYEVTKLGSNETDFIASKLAKGLIIGVMKGRAEFGPRALGNRSILADPRGADMKSRINKIVKGREDYRPFAPVVPLEDIEMWFENPQPSPYMSFTLTWKEKAKDIVPAVVHKDGTGRVQTVSKDRYPWLYQLTQSFKSITRIPIILNTSFNVMGKPIVHSVNDAISVLSTTGLDAILLENYYIEKNG